MVKTIKELADELGVSKDKVKYQVKKLPSNYLAKLPSGTITINTDGIRAISESLGKITRELPTKATHPLPIDNSQFITHLEKQVEQQQKQIEKLQRLLENQQILTLKSQERVNILENEGGNIEIKVPNKKKKKWFR